MCIRRHFPTGRRYQELMLPHRKQYMAKEGAWVTFLTDLAPLARREKRERERVRRATQQTEGWAPEQDF